MRPIERSEILTIAGYEPIRDRFRARVIQEKKQRRVAVGPNMTAVFENRDTVLMQIQEMLRTERITREGGILHEIETYNQLLPGPSELSATIMIEIEDTAARDAFLSAASGIEECFTLRVGDAESKGMIDRARLLEGRASAVQYMKFQLRPEAMLHLKSAGPKGVRVALAVDHAAYRAEAPFSAELVAHLVSDLETP
jgi:hypothetical protein